MIGEFNFVFASFRPALPPLPEREGIGSFLTFNIVGVIVFALVLASLGSPLPSLHEAVHSCLEFDGLGLLLLLGLLNDGFFIFTAFGPAPPPVLLVVVIRRLFIILADQLLVVLMAAMGLIFPRLVAILTLALLLLILCPTHFLHLLEDGSIVGVRDEYSIALLSAFDFEADDNVCEVDGNFVLYFEYLGCGGVWDFVDDPAYVYGDIPYLL